MSETRQGEIVRLTMEHEDSDGKRMWDMHNAWYGFDNAAANDFVLKTIEALVSLTRGLSDEKNK